MGEKALTAIEPREIKVTKDDLDSYLFGMGTKLTDPQKKLFYGIALSFNLNPLKREIYAVPFGDRMSIITGYETYLKRAERTGQLDGWDATVTKEKDGELVATCTVYRKDQTKPIAIQAWFNEYNQGNQMWKSKPRTMIRKVAIAQAFRMAFPDELGGMPYTSDEIGEVQELAIVPPAPTIDKPPKSSPRGLDKPTEESPTATEFDDIAYIERLALETGTPVLKILEAYKVKSLRETNPAQRLKIVNRLKAKQENPDG